MKITSNFNTKNHENDITPHNYPRLMVKSSFKRKYLIVLFDTPTSGMVLYDSFGNYKVGTYKTDWLEYLFVPFYGDITVFSSEV